uniref:Uncharacterized protein n=1 Tax=Fundulus heteroclitus TaxID=8078 RepID=A0A3Q2P212_FUNHE
SAISSGSLEQSLPAAALRSCTKTWSSSNASRRQGTPLVMLNSAATSKSCSEADNVILAKPRALDARSLASWNSSFKERLRMCCRPNLISSEAVLSSALSQNSLPLFCKPASRNSPVDSSSIPAMFSPDCSSPPRM